MESAETSMQFDVDVANVGKARRFVQSSVGDSVPAVVAADLVLATSELVTNAFEHAGTSVTVVVRSAAGSASVTVRSGGVGVEGIGEVDGWRPAPPESVTGRGLGIVNHLADRIDFVHRGGDIEITVQRHW